MSFIAQHKQIVSILGAFPVQIHQISDILLNRSKNTGKMCSLADAEELIMPQIVNTGITFEKREILAELSTRTGTYPIDTEDMLLSLGAISKNSNAAHIQRSLLRAEILTDAEVALIKQVKDTKYANTTKILLQTQQVPAGMHSNTTELVFQSQYFPDSWHLIEAQLIVVNNNCIAIRVGIKKSGKTYYVIKYQITISAAHKVLMRDYNENGYANYFSIQIQLNVQYKLFQGNYEIWQRDLSIGQKDTKIDDLTQLVKRQSDKLDQLMIYTKDSNEQIRENNTQIKELNKKVEILNTRFVMFARVIIPTWLGSKVLEQQYCTFDALKGQLYAKKHLKVMFFVGFFIANDDTVETTKIVNDKEIKLRIRGTMKIFSCCTNFGNVGARIKKLYERFTIIKGDPKNPQKIIMFMLKPHAITLISTEINSERIVSENCTYANHVSEDGIILNPRVFPSDTIASWNSKFKCYDLQVCTRIFDKATAIFETICNNATHERYQGYQQRIDGYDRESDEHLTPQLVEYINSQDQVFYDETRPYSQIFINDYVYEVVDEDHDAVEWSYKISEKTKCVRNDVDNLKFTNCHYALNRILHLIRNLGSKDYVQDMIDSNLISDRDIPAMKAIAAKTKDLEVPRFEELEEEA